MATATREVHKGVSSVRGGRDSALRRAVNFFYDNLPVGDRLGEFFYATWMLMVSVGILNSFFIKSSNEALLITLTIAIGVNLSWGIIDGVSVMYSLTIARAAAARLVYALRTKRGDPSVREEAIASFEDSIVGSLSPEEQAKVVDMIAAGVPVNPSRTKFRTTRPDRHYAVAILLIELMTTVPVLLPLMLVALPWVPIVLFVGGQPVSSVLLAIWASRFIAITLFALLGISYAKHTNRNRVVATVFLAALILLVASLSWYFAW